MCFWTGSRRGGSSCSPAFATWTPEPVCPALSGPDDTCTDLRTLGCVCLVLLFPRVFVQLLGDVPSFLSQLHVNFIFKITLFYG